jgi:hypothetical protein
MDEIRDRLGAAYRVMRSPLQADGTVIYHVFDGTELVARAVLRFFKCCIDDVLVCPTAARASLARSIA